MFVKERMTTNPTCVEPGISVSKAFMLMTESKHSQLPVVDEDNKLVGLVTEKLLAEVNPSKATSLSVYEINYLLSKTKVKDIMKTGIFSINQNALIEDAALIMKENRIGSLPVVDDNNYLVGIVTRVDIFKAFIDILGVKASGTRIGIKVKDDIGIIADITSIIKKHNIDIRNISNFNEKGHLELIIKVRSLETDALVEELKSSGYEVISVTKQH
jgi:acetoin utilization protein AcuB